MTDDQEIRRLTDELEAAKDLLRCVGNGSDIYRPDLGLDGILLTREFEARVEAFLTNHPTNRIRDFIIQKSNQIKKSLDHDENGNPLPKEQE